MKETNFILNEKQEEDLVEYALDRVEQLKQDNLERMDSDKLSWKTYDNDRDDRPNPESIFGQSNVSIPFTSLVVDHFLARAEDEITGSSPYFKFNPQGPTDLPMAASFDNYFHWKLETRGRGRA